MRAPTPIIEICPPHKNPPLETPKKTFLRIDLPENEQQRGLDANHANFNANRRDSRESGQVLQKMFLFWGRIDSRESAKRWCASRLPTPINLVTNWLGASNYVRTSEPKEHKSLCPDTRPGRPEKVLSLNFYVQKFHVPCLLPMLAPKNTLLKNLPVGRT